VESEDKWKGEIPDFNPKPLIDDIPTRLEFWRNSKKYLTTLAARINQLRVITQETNDRMRRHGTAEVLERVNPDENTEIEIIEESAENGIMATLQAKFLDLHKKLERLEIIVTGMRLGRQGPQDPEYSQAWIERHVHEDEKKEFEETAVRMGFPPNSVPMEPQIPADHNEKWKNITDMIYERMTSIGVGGEYKDNGFTLGENMPYPLNIAGRYTANSGMDEFQKEQKVLMLAHTFKTMGIEMKDPLSEESELEAAENEEIEKDVEPVQEGASEGAETLEDSEEAVQEDQEAESPIIVQPGEKISAEYLRIMTEMRKSMKEMDKEVSELEDSYDAFLDRQSPPSNIISPQNPSQGASL
jgi:hypothetical protein